MSALRLAGCACLLGLLLTACGDGQGSSNSTAGLEIPDSSGATISGNVSAGISKKDRSVLVLVMHVTPDNPEPFAPVGVGVVGKDGRFSVSDLPAGHATILFLRDDANDGALDPNDKRARLEEKGTILRLEEGDRAELIDVQLDFAGGSAVAANIEVARRNAEPTPTPDTSAAQ